MKTIWSKYKVFISGLIGAIIIGLLPVLQPTNEAVTIVSIVMAAITAASSWFANNLRGKAQSISGIIFSVAIMVVPVLFAHGNIDFQKLASLILTQVAAQFFGYSSAPFKPASYEHNEVIVQAKEKPPVDQVPLPKNQGE